ncbi:hypothetical protein [Fulvivirga sedimenti]|uniref:Neutral/alkaline non-lysosomal ceramidase N-terminal domain-containing protein n=1 Tax=Fulvivirga sedimenti TaxID=2879465 RepID=A0A9X1HV83_9BACT|nr:hypothetical protein [Fulvivirga sedimenti]MCA6078540.1 hypothetical protein [Fulvivirga sedimenti]
MKIVRIAVIAFAVIFVLGIVFLKPLNRTPLEETGLIEQARDSIAGAMIISARDTLPFMVSYGRVNITPEYPMPMAGYSQRDAFNAVHDSLFCRVIMLEKDSRRLYMISADLLIFPEELKSKIQQSFLSADPGALFYFSATHTHNGLGGWADGLGGELIAGEYHPEWIDKVTRDITELAKIISGQARKSTINYFEADAQQYVKNRLVAGAPVDGKIRGLKINRASGDSLVLFTYSGHPTLLDRKSLTLSNDYPGATIEKLETRGYAFAMFMAGMVGSHRITNIEGNGFERISSLSDILTDKISSAAVIGPVETSFSLLHYEIPFGPSQARIGKNIAVRNWVFSSVLQPLKGSLTAVNIGGLNLVSTPCDFSGELYDQIRPDSKPVIITSFNGDYVGYITKDAHYDNSDYMEVRTMNWVGPYYGDHFAGMINQALHKINH